MKWKTLLVFALSLTLMTGCKKDKNSNNGGNESIVHTEHIRDQYGFCQQGKEYLGTTLVEGTNTLEVTAAEPLFFRIQGRTHSFVEFDVSEATTIDLELAFPQYYSVGEAGPKPASEEEFENFMMNSTENDYFYIKLVHGSSGLLVLNIRYEHAHHGNEAGFCVDDGTYLGSSIGAMTADMWMANITGDNAVFDADNQTAVYYKATFEEGANYTMLRREENTITTSYFIKTGDDSFAEVDIRRLYETEAYSRSVDHLIYIKFSFLKDNHSSHFTYFRFVYEVDEYGFGSDGVYRGNTWEDAEYGFGLINTQFEYKTGYQWRFRVEAMGGALYTYNRDTSVYTYKTYLRNKETKEMVEVTDIDTVAPFTKANKDTYDPFIYFVVELTGPQDGYGYYITVTTQPHQQHSDLDEYGFCGECGLYDGHPITLSQTVNCGTMNKGDVWFGRFAVEAGKQYYKRYTNFDASEIKFYGLSGGGFTPLQIGVYSNPTTAEQTDDGYYYVVVKPEGTVTGSFTIYEVEA